MSVRPIRVPPGSGARHGTIPALGTSCAFISCFCMLLVYKTAASLTADSYNVCAGLHPRAVNFRASLTAAALHRALRWWWLRHMPVAAPGRAPWVHTSDQDPIKAAAVGSVSTYHLLLGWSKPCWKRGEAYHSRILRPACTVSVSCIGSCATVPQLCAMCCVLCCVLPCQRRW